jgi:hypothetical protein
LVLTSYASFGLSLAFPFCLPYYGFPIDVLLDFCDNFRTNFVTFSGLFFEFSTPSTLGVGNFFNSNPFFMIFSVSNVPIKRIQVLFGHQEQQSPPFGSDLP